MSEHRSFTEIIAIGFCHKYGDADYRLSIGNLERLSFEDMNRLRAMFSIAIAQVEMHWAKRPGQENAMRAKVP